MTMNTSAINNPVNRTTDTWICLILVLAVGYQALLCLLNTLGIAASVAVVGAAEAVIMVACLPFLLRRMAVELVAVLAIAGAFFCLAAITSGQFNIKAVRDLLIPLWFLWLGYNLGNIRVAERALVWLIVLVLGMGVFEWLLLDVYTSLFDIYAYYINTGNIAPVTDYVRESRLQLNGIRPEGIGRTLLPDLLGSHRISSVFLEPVSLGNFATVIAAWGLAYNREQWRKALLFLGAAFLMVVLADSRFALVLIPAMFAIRLLMHGKALYLASLAPLAGVLLVLAMGATTLEYTDSFAGRLALCGWALEDFNLQRLMGLDLAPNYGDMGYAYLISRFGLPLCLLLWAGLWLLPLPDERSQRFRAFVAVYAALILSVSGTSLFAFKTSALLWFLMGCLIQRPAPIRQPEPAISTHATEVSYGH